MKLERLALPTLAPRFAVNKTEPELAAELVASAVDACRALCGTVWLGEAQPLGASSDLTREQRRMLSAAPGAARIERQDGRTQLVLPLRVDGLLALCFDAQVASLDVLTTLAPLAEEFARAIDQVRLLALVREEQRARAHAETILRETRTALVKHQQVGKMGDFRYNTRTRESFASLECYKLFGLDPALQVVDFTTWSSTIVPEDRQRTVESLLESVQALRPMSFEYRVIRDGELRRIRCLGEVDRDHEGGDLMYYGVLTDVTELRETEAAMRRQQSELESALRFASLGELAGAIIHEINQPLTSMTSGAEASKRWLSRTPPEVEEAMQANEIVVREVRRAVSVVNGLKSLVRGTTLQRAPVELNAVLRNVLAMARLELDQARIRTDLQLGALPTLSGDLTQLQQAVFNLVRNGIDAMKGVEARERVLQIRSSVQDGTVEVTIADVGEGVPSEQLARLFDPFYTTKADGLGFGLSITRKIVAAHGGRIWASANQRFGITVHVALPLPGAALPDQGGVVG
jgi:two-component system sensor kinase FixL